MIKLTKQNSIIGGIIIVLLFSVVFSVSYNRIKSERDSWQSIAHSSQKEAEVWRNKEGLSQAKIQNIQAGSSQINEQFVTEFAGLKKEISGLKSDLKNLQSVNRIALETKGQVTTALRDTVFVTPFGQESAKTFAYSDRWATIDGYFLRDTAQIKYKIRDSVDVVQYWRRPGLFKPRVLFTEVISRNPNSELTQLKSISTKQPTKTRFAFGPFVGVDLHLNPTLGIGVQYRLIEF